MTRQVVMEQDRGNRHSTTDFWPRTTQVEAVCFRSAAAAVMPVLRALKTPIAAMSRCQMHACSEQNSQPMTPCRINMQLITTSIPLLPLHESKSGASSHHLVHEPTTSPCQP